MKFTTTAPDRRTLVKAIAEHTGMEPNYAGPPTFNYTVGTITVDREGYQWQHEPVLYGWKKNGKHQWYTGRKETTIWEFDKPKKNGDHPTMKPIALLAYPIMNSSMSNAVVLDPFGGSGSTLIACEQSDRICYTVELDEKFCDVIVKRYIEQVGSSDGVTVQRDGVTFRFDEVANVDN